MSLTSRLKNAGYKSLLGKDIDREYICLSLNKLDNPAKVYLRADDEHIDITEKHIFLAYEPLIIALPVEKLDSKFFDYLSMEKQIKISFVQTSNLQAGNHLADLVLKLIEIKDFEETALFIFEGVHGNHNLLPSFYKFTNQLYERFSNKGPNNIHLPKNLYEQVRIAYCVPRIISIITVGNNEAVNMFPTDLHGSINKSFYISSLRHEGKANSQVEELKKVVISNVEGSFANEAYAMGKNHMKDLQEISNFNVKAERSEIFGLPVPSGTIEYKELEQIDSTMKIGIHNFHVYKILNHKILEPKNCTLAVIHRYYQAWRRNHGLETNYLLN